MIDRKLMYSKVAERFSQLLSFDSGYYVIDLPTGFGKSHALREAIDNTRKKVVYVVPTFKTIQELEEKGFLVIKGQTESMKKYISIFGDKTQEAWKNIKGEDDEQNLSSLYEKIYNLNEQADKPYSDGNYGKEIHDFLINDRNNCISIFYKMLKGHIKKLYDQNPDILDRYRNKNKEWLLILLPEFYFSKYTRVVMTYKKLIRPLFIDAHIKNVFLDDDFSDYIFIFDEVSEAKNDFLEFLIELSVSTPEDAFQFFGKLDRFLQVTFPSNKKPRIGTSMQDSFTDSDFQWIRQFQDDISSITEKYHLNYPYHIEDISKKRYVFSSDIFPSFISSNFDKGSITHIYAYFDNESNRMVLSSNKPSNLEQSKLYRLDYIIGNLQRFFSAFAHRCRKAIQKYQENCTLIGEYLSFSDATSSFFHYGGLTKYEKEYMRTLTNYTYTGRGKKFRSMEKLTRFTITRMRNDSSHNDHTSFLLHTFFSTPEILVAKLAEKNIVLGVSASASIPMIHNFNIAELNELLGEKFSPYDDSLHQLTRGFYNQLSKNYKEKNIQIHIEYVKPFSAEKIDSRDIILSNFHKFLSENCGYSNKDALALTRKISSEYNGCDCYRLQRFSKLLLAAIRFMCAGYHRAGLFFLPIGLRKLKVPKGFDIIDSDLDLFESCMRLRFPDENFRIISANDGDSEKRNLAAITQKLKVARNSKQKILLMAQHMTLFAGVNLQVDRLPDSDSINVTPFLYDETIDKREKQEDFDFIFIGSYHHFSIFPNPKKPHEWNENKSLICINYVYEMLRTGEISPSCFSECIDSLSCFYSNSATKYVDEKLKHGLTMNLLVQEVGRISRVFCKYRNISIFLDIEHSKNLADLDFSTIEPLTPELQALVDFSTPHLTEESLQKTREEKRRKETYLNNTKRQMSASYIGKLLNTIWDTGRKVDIERYISIRQTLIHHPTISKDLLDSLDKIPDFMYLNFNVKTSRYRVRVKKEQYATSYEAHNAIEYCIDTDDFILPDSSSYDFTISSLDDSLSAIRKNSNIVSYLAEQGCSLVWNPDEFILNPYSFQIYKGIVGEMVGKYILSSAFIDTSELASDEKFEFFDERITAVDGIALKKKIWVDYKNWSDWFGLDQNVVYADISQKAVSLQSDLVILINLLNNPNVKSSCRLTKNGSYTIMEIPGILNPDGSIHIGNLLELKSEIKRLEDDFNE